MGKCIGRQGELISDTVVLHIYHVYYIGILKRRFQACSNSELYMSKTLEKVVVVTGGNFLCNFAVFN